MQDSWSTVLYMCKKSMDLLGTAGAWWLVAACVPGSLGCWCSLTGVMLAADGEAGSKVFWLLWSSSAWVWSLTVLCSVWERMRKGERCGVQGKAVKEWRWLWWLCGWMEVAVAISWVRWLSRPAAVLPSPSPQVSLLGAQYAWTPVASSCVISGSLFTSQNFI